MAREYKGIVLIDMDGVLVTENSNIFVARMLGEEEFALELEERRRNNLIDSPGYNIEIARIYERKTRDDILNFWMELPKIRGIAKTTRELKRLGFVTAVCTSGLGDFARLFQERLGFDLYHGGELIFDEDSGLSTGFKEKDVSPEDKVAYAEELCKIYKLDCSALIAVEDSFSGYPLFEFVREKGGRTISFNDKNKELALYADHKIESDSLFSIIKIIKGDLKNPTAHSYLD